MAPEDSENGDSEAPRRSLDKRPLGYHFHGLFDAFASKIPQMVRKAVYVSILVFAGWITLRGYLTGLDETQIYIGNWIVILIVLLLPVVVFIISILSDKDGND